MKKMGCFLVLCSMVCSFVSNKAEQKNNLTVQLDVQQQEKMKFLIGLIHPDDTLQTFASLLKNDLDCPQQKLSGFQVTIQNFEKVPSKKMIKKFAQDGFPVVLFLQADQESLEWRLYDSLHATMQTGKRMLLKAASREASAHMLADQLWLILTGQEGIFSTKIAYCVQTKQNNHTGSDIYVMSPCGSNAERLVQGGKLLGPRWNKDTSKPLLLFSEVTTSNVRLMVTTMQGARRLVSNFEGLTMLPSFSSDGKSVVYCASYKGTSQIYCTSLDAEGKRKITKRVTHNAGNNTSPMIRDNGDIIFCSDFETKFPQIYYVHANSGNLERLTESGYCACPNFSEKSGKIAYCKLVNGCVQIFLYDVATKNHKQLTFNKGNKDECCWSPCGNYVAFSVEERSSSRIAILNLMTNEQVFLTSRHQHCTYPSWSMPQA